MKSTVLSIILIVMLIAIPCFILHGCINYGERSVTKEYVLSELDEGVYGIYTVVSSSIPAQNYEMITLCVNGQVHTFKGHVNIHYSDGESKLILQDKNYINSDIINVYVPCGTITYSANVGIGSRR